MHCRKIHPLLATAASVEFDRPSSAYCHALAAALLGARTKFYLGQRIYEKSFRRDSRVRMPLVSHCEHTAVMNK